MRYNSSTGRVFIIAEAGVNHNGSMPLAKKMIDAASRSGADAVKFQTFRSEDVMTARAKKLGYQKKGTAPDESWLEMAKKLEFDRKEHEELIRYAGRKKIIFLSSPFDIASIRLLDEFGLGIIKVPSGEIVNAPYLAVLGRMKKKVILSSGMATLREVRDAIAILVRHGTKKKDITVLHCTSEYPAPYDEVNLKAMVTIRERLGVSVGYSDHTKGIEVAVAAAALGAKVIEKHFTLDKTMSGPDQRASLEPEELSAMVSSIRNVEHSLGTGIKCPSRSEIRNMRGIRKSIVAARRIKKGELFSADNITAKRPGTGLSPMAWDRVIGRKARKDFNEEDLITL